MKIKSLLLLATITIVISSGAQTCSSDYFFYTQQDLDQFLIDNPTCTTYEGSMYVYPGDAVDPITNLDALQNLTFLNYLEIGWAENPVPLSLSGLSSVTQMTNFVYYGNSGATNLDGLENLITVEYLELNLYGLSDIHALDGLVTAQTLMLSMNDGDGDSAGGVGSFYDIFPNLVNSSIINIGGGMFSVADNITGFNAVETLEQLYIGFWYMDSFDGFHNLQQINMDMHSEAWDATSISAFENLISVNNINMRIELNDVMPQFESLTTVSEIILYLDNVLTSPDFPMLTDVSGLVFVQGNVNRVGFTSLQHVGSLYLDHYGYLNILDIGMMQSIENDLTIAGTNIYDLHFLQNVTQVVGAITIIDNQNLSDCHVQFLCDRLTMSTDNVVISNNAAQCATIGEVLNQCGESFVEGLVYVDFNCDGVYNGADEPYSYPIMLKSNGLPFGSTEENGVFYVPLEDNTTETISVSLPPYFTFTPQTFTTGSELVVFSDVEFPLCPDPDQLDVGIAVTMLSTGPRPGWTLVYQVDVTNYGVFDQPVIANFDFSEMQGMSFVFATGNPVLVDEELTWNIAMLEGLSTQSFQITMHLDNMVEIGTVLQLNVGVIFTSEEIVDSYQFNNGYKLVQTVIGSVDPNDISVNVPAIDYDQFISAGETWLGYTIRFQNTGTAPAIFVNVEDIIDEDLDITSIQTLSASHEYTIHFEENRKVRWNFEDIMLADSTSDEPGSHGYIHFVIRVNQNIQLPEQIEGTAAIFFDYNEPVITNTATTLFYQCLAGGIVADEVEVCEGETLVLFGFSGWDQYAWSANSVDYGNAQLISLENLTPGSYDFELISTTFYCTDLDTVNIIVHEIPAAPTITQSGNTLTASGNGTYTWYLEDQLLPETTNTLEMSESGLYTVIVNSGFCSSDFTMQNFTIMGIEETPQNEVLSIYPNPMTEHAILKWEGNETGALVITITDVSGKLVKQQNMFSNLVILSGEELPAGVYMVSILQHDKSLARKKFIVN